MMRRIFGAVLMLAFGLTVPPDGAAQLTGVENGEWLYLGGDAGQTRSNPGLTQIDASNFSELEVAWIWRGSNFGAGVEYTTRATPVFVNGVLYTVSGQRRQVVAIDAATGETLWTFREPETTRYLRSPRTDFGKGVAYAEVDGRGVIYVTSPAFFLWALDARTGDPLDGWGKQVGLEEFSQSGVVDLVPDLMRDWGPWMSWDGPYDPNNGVPQPIGMVTASSPPIVVNGVVVVLVGHEPSYDQTRIENIPGDIMGYDARTGEQLWKFHVIPRPGEFGHETWENDAWQWSGDMSSWAPAAADPELGLVYLVTNASTVQSYAGHRPGHNLFGGSVLALDVKTGERRWHFQIHHSDQWNYDLPNVPMVVDLEVDGREIPSVIQTTKHGLQFAFNRETGEPIWPIEEVPVTQTVVPGNWTAATQPVPTRPEPTESFGLLEEDLVDFTPELREQAIELIGDYRIGGPFMPRLYEDHNTGVEDNIRCYGVGLNIPSPATIDPTTGILYVPSTKTCSGGSVAPGALSDEPDNPATTGSTISQWVAGPGGGLPRVEGLRAWKPPYSRLNAYDMNTGERIWWIPTGDAPEDVVNHPALQGIDTSEFGSGQSSIQIVAGDLLLATEGSNGPPVLNAFNKLTGEFVGEVELPGNGQYGMMTYLHDGQQYVVVQLQRPGRLVALKLPG